MAAEEQEGCGRLCLGLWMAAPAWITVLTGMLKCYHPFLKSTENSTRFLLAVITQPSAMHGGGSAVSQLGFPHSKHGCQEVLPRRMRGVWQTRAVVLVMLMGSADLSDRGTLAENGECWEESLSASPALVLLRCDHGLRQGTMIPSLWPAVGLSPELAGNGWAGKASLFGA